MLSADHSLYFYFKNPTFFYSNLIRSYKNLNYISCNNNNNNNLNILN